MHLLLLNVNISTVLITQCCLTCSLAGVLAFPLDHTTGTEWSVFTVL